MPGLRSLSRDSLLDDLLPLNGSAMNIAKLIVVLLATMVVAASSKAASPIESELVVLTPVGKTLTDPALDEFTKYAKEKWNVIVRTSALAAGAPVAYGRVIEWNGRPAADILWGGEVILFDRLVERNLLQALNLQPSLSDRIPSVIGAPKPVRLKDKNGFWIGTLLESYGIVYHPKVLERLGAREPADWDDLLQPQLKGQVVQCSPTLSGSSPGAYEVILQRDGDEKGWEWLRHLAANAAFGKAVIDPVVWLPAVSDARRRFRQPEPGTQSKFFVFTGRELNS